MTGWPAPEHFQAQMTLTVKGLENGSIITSLDANGDMSSELFSKLFYAGPELPPADLDPTEFWAAIMSGIAAYLAADL